MVKRHTCILLAVLSVVSRLPAGETGSRGGVYAGYSNLWHHADLVIIGLATYTRDTGERREMASHDHSIVCEEVETSFRVRLVMKGTNDVREIDVRHFRVPKGQEGFCFFGPKLARFMLPREDVAGGGFAPPPGPPVPEYLLFLKGTEGRHYVPVSGQEWADYSLREVYGFWSKPTLRKTQPDGETTQKPVRSAAP